ncbi:hypothetical protein LCGC14_1131850 [marine sediment metagenome]|uniref:Uncharacterized protein n=1 Tax=marine sediment metagenome TaxID=412755 RepID=A0A0F9M5S5_9ZZZZ
MIKKKTFIFVGIIIALILTIIWDQSVENLINNSRKGFKIQMSYEASLEYEDYIYFYTNADENDIIEWEFSGTNDFVGITVLI